MAGNSAAPKELPAFLQSSRADVHGKYEDLEWMQRHRLAEGSQGRDTGSEWARVSGDDVLRRNRYANIDPYVNNRVRLKVPEGADDYINASPIALNSSKNGVVRRYIATQGPKQMSVPHFWSMVWHDMPSPAVIVMLTQTHEAGREKCFQYYPEDMGSAILEVEDEDGGYAGRFRATIELLESKFDIPTRSSLRKLLMKVGDQEKTVWHYLFNGWPDFFVPEDEDRVALLQLLKDSGDLAASASENKDSKLRIVHCSAGVGRSGTFIALDHLLSELADGALDQVPAHKDMIVDTVDELRKQRMMMVQGEVQFRLLYTLMKEQWLVRFGLRENAAASATKAQNGAPSTQKQSSGGTNGGSIF